MQESPEKLAAKSYGQQGLLTSQDVQPRIRNLTCESAQLGESTGNHVRIHDLTEGPTWLSEKIIYYNKRSSSLKGLISFDAYILFLTWQLTDSYQHMSMLSREERWSLRKPRPLQSVMDNSDW